MTTIDRIERGQTFHRWTVIRFSTPAQRRPNESLRQRVLTRCVCGFEKILWIDDLRSGRSTGCRSSRCRSAHELKTEIVKAAPTFESVDAFCRWLDRWVSEARRREEERAAAEDGLEDEGESEP